MRSLLSLLEGAVRRSASQVTLESGQPVVYTTTRGAEAESTVLPRTDLFEMIVAAVDDTQQVELAVGNPVEFSLDAGASWTIYAEPGMEGITVRARREGTDAASLEIELDYIAAAQPGPDSHAPPSELSVQALDAPSLEDTMSSIDFGVSGPAPAPAAFESGTWALAEDEEFAIGGFGQLGDSDESGSFAKLPGLEPERHIGVPSDDDDDGFVPFSEPAPASDLDRRRTLSPTVKAMSASPVPLSTPAVIARGAAARATLPDIGAISATPGVKAAMAAQASTRREMTAMRSPEADTLRELPTFGAGRPAAGKPELNDLIAEIAEGALVYVREPGLIDALTHAFLSPSITIDDQADPLEVWSRVRASPAGAILIVRCEDPSELLGWILRRLEEGYRVFVETRARTPEGARRVLLGVAASERAERWLASQLTLTLVSGQDGPEIVSG